MKIRYIALLLLVLFIIPVSFAAQDGLNQTIEITDEECLIVESNEDLTDVEESYYDDENIIGPDLSDDFTNYKFSFKKENTFYVNSSYNGSKYSGTQEEPFKDVYSAFSEISFNRNIVNVYIAKGNYSLPNSIIISKNLNIIGESSSNTIINGLNSQIFNINKNNLIVNIFNLTLSGGSSYYGGAVYNNRSTVNLVNDIFIDNQAIEKRSLMNNYSAAGGALYNEAGYYKIYNTRFINNRAFSSLNAYGGVLYNDMGKVKILKSYFYNNTIYNATYGSAGVIYNFNGFLTISNSSFINNSIDSNYSIGGVIYNYESHNVYIINSTLDCNKVHGNYSFASAIANKGVLLEIINSTIKNSVVDGISIENSTVYNINGVYNLINTKFENNVVLNNQKNILMALEDQIILSKLFNDEEIPKLPAKYDLREEGLVTSVKNQGSSGDCWAFTTLAALESFLLKHENITYDFSENNMKNIMGSYSVNGTDWSEGGNYQMAVAYLVRWDGPVNESDDSFSAYSIISNYDLAKVKHVQDVAFVPLRMGYLDNDQIKYAIMKYGAVYTSIYGNAMSRMVYNPTQQIPNHAVTIVGWDDNYSVNRFVGGTKPPANGAWIIKNSWGSSYGDRGFGYVSYYDVTFAGFSLDSLSVMAFTNVENTTNYKDIYQYDLLGNTYESLGYNSNIAWMANQFTAISNNPLSAFGLYTYGVSQYLAKIYVNNDLKYSQEGNIDYAGYHTIKLGNLVNLTKGDIFRIEVMLNTLDSLYPIAIETNRNGYSSKVIADLNQSFVSPDGVNWYDIAQDTELVKVSDCMYNKTLKMTNVCLKAYTANVADLILNISTNTSFFIKNDSIFVSVNLTNVGDYVEDINVTLKLDQIADILDYNISKGNFVNKLWHINSLKHGETVLFDFILKINENKDVINNNFTINCTDNNKIVSFNFTYAGFTKIFVEDISTIISKTNNQVTIKLVDMLNNPVSNKTIIISTNDANKSLITDDNGIAMFYLNLPEGQYVFNAFFNGDDEFWPSSTTFNVTVVKIQSNAEISLLKIEGNSKLYYKLILRDVNGKALPNKHVQITFNGKNYQKTTDKTGAVSIKFSVSKAGTYNCIVAFSGDEKYYSTSKLSKIVIAKKKPVLKVPKKTFKASKKVKKLTATLKDNKGKALSKKKVTFIFKGKKYSIKTNSKGKATAKIKLSKKGKFKFTVKFAGDNLFSKVSKKGKLIIK